MKNNMSLNDAAFAAYLECGCKLNYIQIHKYESGNTYPGLKSLYALCKVFDVSADYLLGLKDKEEIE